MAEPQTRAQELQSLFPWLRHWTISDERIGGFRSDAYALETSDGQLFIDALPLEKALEEELQDIKGLFLTHGNHQRSAWRFRRETGAPVYAPKGVVGLDEDPDSWYDSKSSLPGGLKAIESKGFSSACYLTWRHRDGTGVLFCGDLICHTPNEPYRFPKQEGYFDSRAGKEDARGLLELSLNALCAAHALPTRDGCQQALQGAIDRA